jgi:hypothetical protein
MLSQARDAHARGDLVAESWLARHEHLGLGRWQARPAQILEVLLLAQAVCVLGAWRTSEISSARPARQRRSTPPPPRLRRVVHGVVRDAWPGLEARGAVRPSMPRSADRKTSCTTSSARGVVAEQPAA